LWRGNDTRASTKTRSSTYLSKCGWNTPEDQ
jgi:hypothetical protein